MQNDKKLKESGSESINLEEDLLFYKNLINHSNDAIFVIDPDTSRFLYANDKVINNLGYSRKELLKMTMMDIEEVIPNRASWEKYVREAQKKGYMILLGKHKRKNASTYSVEVNAKYITQDKRDYMIVVARDITERKMAEKEIDKALAKAAQVEQLERELHSLEHLSGGIRYFR